MFIGLLQHFHIFFEKITKNSKKTLECLRLNHLTNQDDQKLIRIWQKNFHNNEPYIHKKVLHLKSVWHLNAGLLLRKTFSLGFNQHLSVNQHSRTACEAPICWSKYIAIALTNIQMFINKPWCHYYLTNPIQRRCSVAIWCSRMKCGLPNWDQNWGDWEANLKRMLPPALTVLRLQQSKSLWLQSEIAAVLR